MSQQVQGRSHYARLEKSARLQKLLRLLSDCQVHTTAEIQRALDTCAAHSDVHELRCNGFTIEGGWIKGKGRRVYGYRLIGQGAASNG